MIEEVFKGRAKEIDHEDVVQAFLAKVVDIRDASCVLSVITCTTAADIILTASDQDLVCSILITQLGSITLAGFLHRHQSAAATQTVKINLSSTVEY